MVCVRPGGQRGMTLAAPSMTYLCELPGSQFPPLDDAPFFLFSNFPFFTPCPFFFFLLPFFFFFYYPSSLTASPASVSACIFSAERKGPVFVGFGHELLF